MKEEAAIATMPEKSIADRISSDLPAAVTERRMTSF